MKKVLQLFTTVIFTVFISFSAKGQVTLQAGVGGGISFPMADYGGTTMDYYSGTQYGLSSGYNLHGKLRVGVLSFIIAGEVGYSSFSNSGDSEPGQGNVEISQDMVSVKAGPEYHFDLPAVPVTPYVGFNLNMNFLSGETTFLGVSNVPSGTYTVDPASRIGLGFKAGGILSAGFATLDIAIEYDIVNVIGKEFKDINPATDSRLDSYLSLNDDADPLYTANSTDHFIGSSRTISVLHLTVSFMFGI